MSATIINQANLTGRVGQDPEVLYFESGSVLAKFSLAVRRPTKNSDQPDWFDLTAWGKIAEVAANYVRTGSLIGITGELKMDEWVDKQTGLPRSKLFVQVHQLELLGDKRNSEASSNTNAQENTDADDF